MGYIFGRSVLDNDTDVNLDPLTAVLVDGPSNGTVDLNKADGTWVYTPARSPAGCLPDDSFTYKASDGRLDSDAARVSLTLPPFYQFPIAHADAYTVTAGTTLRVAAGPGVLANDVNCDNKPPTPANDRLQASDDIQRGPGHASAFGINNDGSFSYTPEPGFTGTDRFAYFASVVGGDVCLLRQDSPCRGTVTITVQPANDAPSFTKGADQTVDEDAGARSVPGWATDISAGPSGGSGQQVSFETTNDNNPLFTAEGQPEVSPDGTLTYTPADDASGSATVSVKAVAGGGAGNTSAAQTFKITVKAVNDAPVATADTKTTPEDTPLVFPAGDLLANDSKGAPTRAPRP